MSLVKVLELKDVTRTLVSIRGDFLEVSLNMKEDKLPELIALYGEFSIAYLYKVAMTLVSPRGEEETMKFMNSIIAEHIVSQGLSYFDKETGKSVVDYMLGSMLDAKVATIDPDKVVAILKEIVEVDETTDKERE